MYNSGPYTDSFGLPVTVETSDGGKVTGLEPESSKEKILKIVIDEKDKKIKFIALVGFEPPSFSLSV